MISPLPGAWSLKPGSATLPFFGVQVRIDQYNYHLNEKVTKVETNIYQIVFPV